MVTDRGDDAGNWRSRPITEAGTLPTVDVSGINNVSSLPRIVGTTFGVGVQAIFAAGLEGGMGDVVAMEMENAQKHHIKEINQELLAGSAYIVSAGAATTFTVPGGIAHHFKPGDAVGMHDESGGAFDRAAPGSAVSAVTPPNRTTGVVTIVTGTAFADGDIAYIVSRAGLTSLDDVTMADLAAASNTGVGGSAAAVDVYDVTTRTAGTWSAGATAQTVAYNSGAGRDLALNLIDNLARNIRFNGGEPNLIVMGHDQYFRLERLLQAQQRFMGYEEYQVGVGDERTFPGTRAGLNLATYVGLPILPEPDCPRSVSTTDAILGTNLYVLDTTAMEIAIASPTQYMENRDYFALNQMAMRGLIYTMGELRAHLIWTQGKVADLNE